MYLRYLSPYFIEHDWLEFLTICNFMQALSSLSLQYQETEGKSLSRLFWKGTQPLE